MPSSATRPMPRIPVTAVAAPCCAPGGEAIDVATAARLAHGFAALADPVRLRVLSLIASAGEICSCDLQGPIGKSQPTISHHTKALAEAGLIVGDRRGKWTWWRVVPDQLAVLQAALDTADTADAASQSTVTR